MFESLLLGHGSESCFVRVHHAWHSTNAAHSPVQHCSVDSSVTAVSPNSSSYWLESKSKVYHTDVGTILVLSSDESTTLYCHISSTLRPLQFRLAVSSLLYHGCLDQSDHIPIYLSRMFARASQESSLVESASRSGRCPNTCSTEYSAEQYWQTEWFFLNAQLK